MPPTQKFIHAWRAWRHAQPPSENFDQWRRGAPTYNVELELGHLHSRLYSLGMGVIDGKALDYAGFASEELASLDRISSELEGCHLPVSEQDVFRSYISAARSLLEEMVSPF